MNLVVELLSNNYTRPHNTAITTLCIGIFRCYPGLQMYEECIRSVRAMV